MSRRGFDRGGAGPVTATEKVLADQFGSQFGTIFTLKPQAKYLTGARTIIKINGSIIGFAFKVSWEAKTIADEIYTIDDPLPWELAPKRIEVSGTLGLFLIPGESPQSMAIQSDIASFLANRYITIEVIDSATDAIIFRAGSAMVTGQQSSLSSEQIGSTMLTWKAVGWQAEIAPKPFTKEELSGPKDNTGTVGTLSSAIKSKFGF